LAIVPLAKMLGTATEEIALKTGDVVGGLLNATFGNAIELIISIAALREGLVCGVWTWRVTARFDSRRPGVVDGIDLVQFAPGPWPLLSRRWLKVFGADIQRYVGANVISNVGLVGFVVGGARGVWYHYWSSFIFMI
jgi:hypothetical protein